MAALAIATLQLDQPLPTLMVQEFHLSITPLGDDRYLARAERVPPGVPLAEEQVTWPVERWLTQAQHLLDDPMLSLLQAAGAGWPDDFNFAAESGHAGNGSVQVAAPSLAELGQSLYDALFQGSLRDSWLVAQGVAHHQQQVLRLRLGLRGDRLPRLPWEVMQDGRQLLATGTDIAFSRYRHGAVRPLVRSQRGAAEPVRILMAIAAPRDQDTLALYQEAAQLQAELDRPSREGRPLLELTILEQPGCEELAQALEQGNFQVFHYAGHSNLNTSSGELYLVSRQSGLTERLRGDDLAGLLANNGIQLALLNSCRGADTAFAQAEPKNLAQALVQHGLPATIAMAERIPDEVAIALTRLFYRNLDQGYPIDISLSRARQGLVAAYGSQQLYWALPVLYLHPHCDGHLLASERAGDFALLDDPDELPLAALARATAASREVGAGQPAEEGLPAGHPDAPFVTRLLDDFRQPPSAAPEEGDAAREPVVEIETVVPPRQLAVAIAPPPARRPPRYRWLWLGLALAGTGAIAGLAAALLLRSPSGLPALPTPIAQLLEQTPPLENLAAGDRDLDEVPTETLAALAIEQLNQGNWSEGVTAVAALLDRNALPFANSALAAVPAEQLDRPEIGFLRGRLAWQHLKADPNTHFSLDDARRYWQESVRQAPEAIAYRNALGFALYAEGNYQAAQQTWYAALDKLEQVDADKLASLPADERAAVLTACAGLALSLDQLAEQSSGATALADRARRLRQVVLTAAPLEFQTDALSRQWLWTEAAIADWQALGQK